MAFFQDNLGKPAPERYTILDFTGATDDGVALALAGPYANHLHLATDSHVSTSSLNCLQAGCPSCHPTNSVKALKATVATYAFPVIVKPRKMHKYTFINTRQQQQLLLLLLTLYGPETGQPVLSGTPS